MDSNEFVIKLNNTEICIKRDVDGKFIIPDELRKFMGIGTGLKPAHEPVVMARKPLEENTVVDNVLKYGTGAINIDESRIPTDEIITNHSRSAESDGVNDGVSDGVSDGDSSAQETHQTEGQKLGRFPANLILDEEAGEILDEQSGLDRGAAAPVKKGYDGTSNGIYGDYGYKGDDGETFRGDSGGASRFFYCPKTSRSERNEGLDGTITNIFYELNDDVSDDVKNQIKSILKLK